ncbi:MAG: hypothetical protein AB7S36_14265 [Planctomycetota bacterium]
MKVLIRLDHLRSRSPQSALQTLLLDGPLSARWPADATRKRTFLAAGQLGTDDGSDLRVQTELQQHNADGQWYSRLLGGVRTHGQHQLTIVTALGDDFYRVQKMEQKLPATEAFNALGKAIVRVLDHAVWHDLKGRPDLDKWLVEQKSFRYFTSRTRSFDRTVMVSETNRQWDFAADGSVTVLDNHFVGANTSDTDAAGRPDGNVLATISGNRKGKAHYRVVECNGETWIVLAFEDLTTAAHRLERSDDGWSIDGYSNGTNETD